MAHVMKPGSNVPGPFSSTTYIPTMTHGWVHANTWYASAPFNAAPPPVPAGVNPQTWMNGQWQPNPMFRPQPGMTQTQVPMWAPHPGWGPAVAQANPFKRIPNPGDASYWATKLSDNPLGLENMHIRDDTPANERHMKDMSNGVPHTPWVWAPKDLAKEGSAPATNNGTASQPQQQQAGQGQTRQSQPDKVLPPPPVIPPPPPEFSQPPTQSLRDHVRTNSNSRAAYDPNPYDQSRSNDRPAPASAPATVSSYSAFQQQQQQQRQQQESQRAPERSQMASQNQHPLQYQQPSQYQQSSDSSQNHVRQRSRDVSPRPPGEPSRPSQAPQSYSSHYRSHTTSSASSSASAAAAAVTAPRSATFPIASSRDRETDRDREAFSSQREMHLTFSPNIVRTPDHYSSPPPRRMSYDDVERTPSRTPVPTHGNIYGPSSATPSRSNSMRRQASGSSPSTPSSTSTSASTTPTGSSSLGLLTFTEEPQGLLSPLVVGGTPPPSKTSPGREVNRSQTYPTANVYPIPEEQERKPYSQTSRSYDRAPSQSRDGSRGWDQRDRERDREDRERERDRRDREREREQDVNSTPQPANRTPPSRTPPSSYYTRPSPESGSHHARQISRSHTLPMANSPSSTSPRHASSPYSQAQQYSSNAAYPGSSSYARTSPNPNPNPAHSRGTSPLRHNPLPRPPAHSAYTESLSNRGSSSASAAAAAHHQQQSTSRRQQVRHGFWNRRGDHLYVTDKGERFIVYAPHHLANPEELKNYPAPTEGFMDHHRHFVKYDPSVPELLDSLPLQGKSPVRPYSSFVYLVDV
ncbi:hypothetical protein L226DRAFT_594088 [Lentinus tigrinus ALCF2SS1-7]|uniref:Uncharacterized protein n=1 Tax=Lentinus tigrinus ALCF2SS1-6 TaxID=1328759 RepID=A0A5C2SPF4_9APHY|nr:hypothetical protein L227DRAFT_218056 [Lentinus tigrinus ALCF2SS1-6]RPD78930.1 hypothetical protein L226DRAFT_594088 [Lentinus tigrinus ALCF2SS1-7]